MGSLVELYLAGFPMAVAMPSLNGTCVSNSGTQTATLHESPLDDVSVCSIMNGICRCNKPPVSLDACNAQVPMKNCAA